MTNLLSNLIIGFCVVGAVAILSLKIYLEVTYEPPAPVDRSIAWALTSADEDGKVEA